MLLGQFLEVGIATRDIGASVRFWEQLGLRHLNAGDTWSHPYGVLSDGRLVIGLHQRPQADLSISFVRPNLAAHLQELRARGLEPHYTRLGDQDFHELQLRDPTGQTVTLLEARTYSPSDDDSGRSLCGYFSALSLPALDFDAAQAFWDHAGFLPYEETERPFPHVLLAGERMNLALHRPRYFDAPLLVFELDDATAQLQRLRDRGVSFLDELPRPLPREQHALLRSPEGMHLLLAPAAA